MGKKSRIKNEKRKATLIVGDTPGGNYTMKMLELGGLAKPGVHEVSVAHDDWCAIFHGNPCNCNPDVSKKK